MTPPSLAAPDQRLAEGFGVHVEQWALARGAPEASANAVRIAAVQLSLATANGHVCIGLNELAAHPNDPDDPSEASTRASTWRRVLLASEVVGTPEAPGSMPMILDAGDRLYLHRYFDYERRLAERLMRAQRVTSELGGAQQRLHQRLNELFAANAARLGAQPDWQKVAAALALRGRLTIISGGPGTGKTTTVVNLLACLIDFDPECRIALAAPTGKAAARMIDAIRERAQHLPEAIRSRLPAQAFTVHRLLGVKPASGGFIHHAAHPLAIDALVIDEASMLDLALATKLLEAVPDSARIVLLGDKDQLAAVESGAVFSELGIDPSLSEACVQELSTLTGMAVAQIRPPAPLTPSALIDAVVWFTQNFRFARDSGIGRLAALINAGNAEPTLTWLRSGGDASVRWLANASVAPPPEALQRMTQGYAPFFEAIDRDPTDHAAISAAFARFRVLCAVRDGPRGVVGINADITRRARTALRRHGAEDASPWYVGRPVLVLRNDYVLKLFNGDIGIALPDESGQLMVFFADSDAGFRAVAPVRLPHHETAFAMTVHKSQGSEFDEVLVMLPEQRSRVLTRELLYTAVTRARSSVTVCATANVLSATIATTTQRHSGLLARLREARGQHV